MSDPSRKKISPTVINEESEINNEGINKNNKYVLSDCDYYKLMLVYALSQINANFILDVDWDIYDEVY